MSAPMKLTKAQRWALLKCRTADRFCDAGTKPKATPEEAKEEQEAAIAGDRGLIPWGTYSVLALDHLIVWKNGWHITDAGRAALADSKEGE